ncbi:hypothetical protein ACSS6W_002036 [Trichoderma asperelloides]
MRVSMFCAVPCFCRVFGAAIAQAAAREEQRTQRIIQTACEAHRRTSCCCGVQHTGPRTSPVSFTIRLRHGNFACGLTKIDQNLRLNTSSHTFGSLETH